MTLVLSHGKFATDKPLALWAPGLSMTSFLGPRTGVVYLWNTPTSCGFYIYILYLSILKSGSYTRRGSNIHRVVQQNEWNERLGPFKCRVPKLLNLIYIMENWLILNISFDVCILFWMLIQLIVYSVFITFVVFPQDALVHFVSEWSPCTFINMLASNHVIKLVNTGTSTCHSPLYPGQVNNRK